MAGGPTTKAPKLKLQSCWYGLPIFMMQNIERLCCHSWDVNLMTRNKRKIKNCKL